MKKYKNIIAAFLILLLSLQLCGAAKDITIDTEKNRLYEYITADRLLSENGGAAFNGSYIMVSGSIARVRDNSNIFDLKGESSSDTIACSCVLYNTYIKNKIDKYSDGTPIAVCGRYLSATREMSIDDIIEAPKNASASKMYFTKDGKAFDYSDTLERSLADGHITFRIPAYLEGGERSVAENELGTLEGYQYILNRKDADPETLFVCYFGKEKLRNTEDISKTEAVEMAIVKNIEGSTKWHSPLSFLDLKTYTYYGALYHYYCGGYISLLGDGYRTEYVFMPDGNRGIVMFLYVYKNEQPHLSDVMFITRFLEVK